MADHFAAGKLDSEQEMLMQLVGFKRLVGETARVHDAVAAAELVGVTPAEVLGTCSFYEMFKLHPVGKYCVNVCTNISCQLLGGEELLEHAQETLGVRSGGTTDDGTGLVHQAPAFGADDRRLCRDRARGPPGAALVH